MNFSNYYSDLSHPRKKISVVPVQVQNRRAFKNDLNSSSIVKVSKEENDDTARRRSGPAAYEPVDVLAAVEAANRARNSVRCRLH